MSADYGYGPLDRDDVPGVGQVLVTAPQLELRVAEMGRQISRDYADAQPVFVGVLKGVLCFISDLIRQVSLPLSTEFITISRSGDSHEGIRITKDLDRSIAGCHVLIVEDIVDTGITLNYLRSYLETLKPASIKVCTLLNKRARRLVDVNLDYVGFEVPDEFVVGYGLDYQEKYRNLPFIAALGPEADPAGRVTWD